MTSEITLKTVFPDPVVSVDDGTIYLNTCNPGWKYPIELWSAASHEAILGWIIHLSGKTWVTRRHIREFVYAACRANGLSVDPYITHLSATPPEAA